VSSDFVKSHANAALPPAGAGRESAEDAAAAGAPAVEKYNVVWDGPSESSFGSMPLGNGRLGLNVWVETNGDLLFYIAKVDALDSRQVGPKLGRIRLTLAPPLPVTNFKQTLSLKDASVLAEAGDVRLRVWVDANQPVIRVEGKSQTPRTAVVALESLRPLMDAADPLPGKGTVGLLFDDKEDRLVWCYRNQSSDWWAANFRTQNTPEMVAKVKDPLLHRTSGCVLWGQGFVRAAGQFGKSRTVLRLAEESTAFDCSVKVISTQPQDLQGWLTEATQPVRSDWDAHCAYWKSFWDRSYIHAGVPPDVTSGGKGKFNLDQCRFTQFPQGSKAHEGHKEIDAAQNAWQISQRYALERFCEACASRGPVPPNANGSLFTMDMPAGVMGGYNRVSDKPISPDFRYWEDCCWFMWQNLRFPYWAMAARGDYDTLRPGMQFVRDSLDICKDHCRKIFGHEGAFLFEASAWLNIGRFNPPGPTHLRHHFLATLETPAIMCDYYEHTRDRAFFENILLPCADEFLKFYEIHYPKRDANGILRMEDVGGVETYQGVTNPATEIGGMKYVLTKMLSFEIDEARRRHWSELLKAMPGVPLRKVRGLDLLAVGEKFHPGGFGGAGDSGEHPELYTIYPFRQVWLGRPELLNVARQSFHLRIVSLDGSKDTRSMETGGWQMSPVQAAYLGLPREAARLTSINFHDQFILYCDNFDPNAPYPTRPRARFPAFWETKTDGTPDCDHGAASANALQSMLLQSDGRRIFLLPAWPEDWDVAFKLCAADNTTVECVFRDGKVQSLKVSPESRRGDIVDMTTPAQRIRTLVEVALADHNYLFGLPPMLDAQPVPGKVTGPWLERYGHTIRGCKAGPWLNSLFCEKVVYVHVLDWPKEGVSLPAIPRKLVSARSIAGNIEVKQEEGGWLLTGRPDSLDTIVRLEFDASVEEIATALPSVGSLTSGRQRSMQSDAAGRLIAAVDLGGQKTIQRFEFTIDNPGYLRGRSRPYEFQVKQADGFWRTAYQGQVFGCICARKIDPVAATAVRVVVQAPGIRQLDVYEE
jgi:hypothetical protein